MPQRFEQRTVPYTPKQMFALVADIERYPDFLPWCHAATIQERKGAKLKASLVVGKGPFRDTFLSCVSLDEPRKITVEYGGGPLERLSNAWLFEPEGDKGCALSFYLDFAFRSPFLSSITDAFFDKAFNKMAAAFEERAREIYG